MNRVPVIKAPEEVYIFDRMQRSNGNMYDMVYNPDEGRIVSDSFFELEVFHHNTHTGGRWVVRGMTPAGASEAIYTSDSTQNTIFHEPLHGMGVGSELVVRPLAQLAAIRSRFNLGFRRRNVKYQEVPMTQSEKMHYMSSRGIKPMSSVDWPIHKYRLVSE